MSNLDHEDVKRAQEMMESVPQAQEQQAVTPAETRKVVRKLDLHLLPLCFLLYTFSVLDRSNLGNARLVGMEEDINLSGNRYQWLGTMFYISYIMFQFNTLGWKIFKPHIWVTFVVLFWGTVSTLQAAAYSWQALMVCRFFLGWAETMFGPGIPLYFSYFYPRESIGLRFGLFLSGSALANAYGGALAYGLGHINSSISNWRLLFIIEGVPTVLLALITWFFLPDRPARARFFNEREAHVAQAYAQTQPEDVKAGGLNIGQLGEAFKDYRNYCFALMNFSCNVSFASLPLFLPSIVRELGVFNTLESNGFTAPPYALCFLLIVATAYVSDRLRLRGPFAAFFAFVSFVGYVILGTATSPAARYVGIFLAVQIFVTVAIILVWSVNTNEGGSKKAGGLWIMQTVGQCGTVLGTNMFPHTEAPFYRRGMWVGAAFSATAGVAAIILSFLLWRHNKMVSRMEERDEVDSGKEGVEVEKRERREPKYII